MTDSTAYDKMRRDYSPARHSHYNFARDVIDVWAEKEPAKRALLWVSEAGIRRDVTFAELAERSCRLANVLAGAGVKRGDTVIIVLGRQLAWWETLTACIRAGFIASPGTTQLSAKDLIYRAEASGAVAIITDSTTAQKLNAAKEPLPASLATKIVVDSEAEGWQDYEALVAAASPSFAAVNTAVEDSALCYFTSGTTGYPKMTMHSHGYPLGHEITGRYWLDLKPDDLHWNISDTGWAKAAWSSYFAPWLMGAALFVWDTPGFDPAASLAMFGRYPITTMCGAPTIYRLFVQQDLKSFSFPHLRHCVGAGEPLNPEVIERWREATNLTIRDGYGQTETVLLCGSFPCIDTKPGSMGKPSPGLDLHVIDEEGRILPPGEEGDIALSLLPIRPQWLFSGYRNDPERTASCFRGDWYLTGDRAYRDDEGYFWFVSRADDVILSSGYRIGPFEVESALIEHPAVMESAVVSSPDPVRGEIVAAYIVLAKGFTASAALEKELQNHVKSVTAPYKYPRKIIFTGELPKTVSGKIRRTDLRAQEWSSKPQ
ncbi:AMP-binding protein [Gimibacter soli]|uniref:AMP-binding protein n=1 Tax=Gimibacter soli TaxID=3024400 RepID=A0AAE9XV66_9PROT|nr:AMP-binding protein [Gimibacter soli]WCL53409.1 AMP-binding protein [Gimibacter soli]